jgi:hypothetical protein
MLSDEIFERREARIRFETAPRICAAGNFEHPFIKWTLTERMKLSSENLQPLGCR